LKPFEDDLARLVENVSFRRNNDQFLKKIRQDLNNVNSSNNVFVFADKTKNIYEVSPEQYNKLLAESIIKS
jgi:hypothetical protein